MFGVLLILFASGTFKTGRTESHSYLEHELSVIGDNIYKDYGSISVHSVELARSLALNFEREFVRHGINAGELQEHPELLEVFLEQELDMLAAMLEKTRSSGAFIILDATVNPSLKGAEHSRAGIFIKNVEPNIVSSTFSTLRFLRGPMSVARNNHMDVLPQWKMEFNIENFYGFSTTIQTAADSPLPISRLYYWYTGASIANNTEPAMYCCVPLRDPSGRVFGISGFEVSSMLYKLSYSPDYAKYNNVFSVFAPLDEGKMPLSNAYITGNFSPPLARELPLAIGSGATFQSYKQKGSGSFLGLHRPISLYPKDSAFGEEWIFALMMPEEDLSAIISGRNRQLFIFLAMLMVISSAISLLVSRRYTRPVEAALVQLKEESNKSQVPKTGIPEIDDLIKFLAEQDDGPQVGSTQEVSKEPHLFSQFRENIKTLSAAERAVFNLYLKGFTAKDISEILCLSINTIKTHNKRIYMKLNVSSRKELMLYIQMLEERNGL